MLGLHLSPIPQTFFAPFPTKTLIPKSMASASAMAAASGATTTNPAAASAAASATTSSSLAPLYLSILTSTPLPSIDAALSVLPPPSPADIESVLRLIYPHPAQAVKFFRWAGLHSRPTLLSWNLMVDVLGRNSLFEPMWDAIRSMKDFRLLSVSTFASAFSSYCSAGKIKEAVMTFDVMDRYSVPQDVLAVNSLLSAICRQDGRTADAADFFDRIKARIPPDADTFAILLEGWEKEGNVQRAKTTFGEMVIRVGWNAENMSAYDAFLTTLVRGGQAEEAINFLRVMKGKNCLPGIKFFANALDIFVKIGDAVHALGLWDLMVNNSGLVPNVIMYNAIIALVCNNKDVDSAYRLLDAMPFHGAFPDSLTYNTIFECLVRNRKAREANKFLAEMRKNEQVPSPSNCVTAVRMFFEEFDPSAAIEVWNYSVEENVRPDDECANEVLIGLANFGRESDVRRYADEMLDMGVHLSSATMEKLKIAFNKGRKRDTYDHIARRVERRLARSK